MSMNQDPTGPQDPYQQQRQQQPPEGTWQPQSAPFNQPSPMPKQPWQGPPPQPYYQQQQQSAQWQPQPGYPPQMLPQQQPGYPPQMFPQQQPGYPPQMFPQQQQLQGYQQQAYPYPYPQQQPYFPPMVNTVVNVNTPQTGHGFFIRALYFLFIGWWAGYIWLNLGFALCAFIITLPIGLAMLNRIPQVLTLRPQSAPQTNVQVASIAGYGGMTNIVNVNIINTQQHSMLIRALYFLFIGCWVGYLWANIGYFLCVSILGLPLGLMMLNRLPAVLTLRKN